MSSPCSPDHSMPSPAPVDKNKHKSPAKQCRSVKRAMLYKRAVLQDIYDIEISVNFETFTIIWNVTEFIKLTLKPTAEVLETRSVFNPLFRTFTLGQKISKFQNMWEPDENSFLFFSCIFNHCKQNTLKCDNFCAQFATPVCSSLLHNLSLPHWSTVWVSPPSHLRGFLPNQYCNSLI